MAATDRCESLTADDAKPNLTHENLSVAGGESTQVAASDRAYGSPLSVETIPPNTRSHLRVSERICTMALRRAVPSNSQSKSALMAAAHREGSFCWRHRPGRARHATIVVLTACRQHDYKSREKDYESRIPRWYSMSHIAIMKRLTAGAAMNEEIGASAAALIATEHRWTVRSHTQVPFVCREAANLAHGRAEKTPSLLATAGILQRI